MQWLKRTRVKRTRPKKNEARLYRNDRKNKHLTPFFRSSLPLWLRFASRASVTLCRTHTKKIQSFAYLYLLSGAGSEWYSQENLVKICTEGRKNTRSKEISQISILILSSYIISTTPDGTSRVCVCVTQNRNEVSCHMI